MGSGRSAAVPARTPTIVAVDACPRGRAQNEPHLPAEAEPPGEAWLNAEAMS